MRPGGSPFGRTKIRGTLNPQSTGVAYRQFHRNSKPFMAVPWVPSEARSE